MKKWNLPLWLGAFLILLLLVVAVLPGMLSDRNPYAMSLIQTWVDDEGDLQIVAPPFEPGERYILGSDKIGRDIWSLVVNGTRLTLSLALAITFLRFLIAVPMGMAGAMGSHTSRNIIDQFNIVLTTIPPLLIGILILKMEFFMSLFKLQSAMVFILTLTVIGWSRMGNLMYESTGRIMSETFILSEKAIGKTKWSIAIRNVLPHLLPEIVVMFFMEIARVLTLMMQLGIFGVFVGNVRLIYESTQYGFQYINLPYEPEWSGLMGATKEYVRSAPWIVFTAAAFFVVSVLAFNLFGEGLRIELQKKNSRMISTVTGLFRNRRETSRDQRFTFAAAGLTLAVLLATVTFAQTDTQYGFENFNDIGYNYDHVIVGSEESTAVAQLIASAMAEMGIAPLDEDGYLQVFDEIDNLYFDKSTLVISDGHYTQTLRFGEDVEIPFGRTGTWEFEVIDLTEQFYDYDDIELSGKLLYVDSEIIPDEAIRKSMPYLVEKGALGVVTTQDEIARAITENRPYFYLILGNSFKDYFQSASVTMSLDMVSEHYDQPGANVAGIIDGQDEVTKDKGIIIALDYTFLTGEDHYEVINAYLGLMKTIKAHQDELENSVAFVFFADRGGAIEYYSEHQLFPTKNILVFHDMTRLDRMEISAVRFSDALSPVSRYYGFTLSKQIKDDMTRFLSDTPAELDEGNSYLYYNKGYTTLIYEAEGEQGLPLNQFLEDFARLVITNAQ